MEKKYSIKIVPCSSCRLEMLARLIESFYISRAFRDLLLSYVYMLPDSAAWYMDIFRCKVGSPVLLIYQIISGVCI